MSPAARIVILLVAAYLLGGVPFGLLVARAKGIDIRKHGSGNVGATNVGRVLGRKFGILVFLLDASKGAACTIAAGLLAPKQIAATETYRDLLWLGAAACAVLGNVASIYLRFKGGKGVATSLGAILGIFPYLTYAGLLVAVMWAAVATISRYVSLASIVAAVSLPFAFVALALAMGWSLLDHLPLLGLCILLAILVVFRHRQNVTRLLAGTENRMGGSR